MFDSHERKERKKRENYERGQNEVQKKFKKKNMKKKSKIALVFGTNNSSFLGDEKFEKPIYFVFFPRYFLSFDGHKM